MWALGGAWGKDPKPAEGNRFKVTQSLAAYGEEHRPWSYGYDLEAGRCLDSRSEWLAEQTGDAHSARWHLAHAGDAGGTDEGWDGGAAAVERYDAALAYLRKWSRLT